MKTLKERRKHKRLNIKNRSIVLVSPATILSYTVLDISESGLAFSCAGCENWSMRRIRLDFLDQNFSLKDILINLIDDVRLDYGSMELHRCGVKFTGLAADKKVILKHYIANMTAKTAN